MEAMIVIDRTLKSYFLAQWGGLLDEALEGAIYDSRAMRNTIGVDLGGTIVSDAASLLKFWHLVVWHNLTRTISEEIGTHCRAIR